MQHGSKLEAVADILENVQAVLEREVRLHQRPLRDVLSNLEAAIDLVQALRSPQEPVSPDPGTGYRHSTPHRQTVHVGTGDEVLAWDAECAECSRIAFCTWCQGPCTFDDGVSVLESER